MYLLSYCYFSETILDISGIAVKKKKKPKFLPYSSSLLSGGERQWRVSINTIWCQLPSYRLGSKPSFSLCFTMLELGFSKPLFCFAAGSLLGSTHGEHHQELGAPEEEGGYTRSPLFALQCQPHCLPSETPEPGAGSPFSVFQPSALQESPSPYLC